MLSNLPQTVNEPFVGFSSISDRPSCSKTATIYSKSIFKPWGLIELVFPHSFLFSRKKLLDSADNWWPLKRTPGSISLSSSLLAANDLHSFDKHVEFNNSIAIISSGSPASREGKSLLNVFGKC